MSVTIDDRIKSLIKYSNYTNHRSFFILIGENTKQYIPILYNLLAGQSTRSVESIIWCHKNKNIVKEVKSAKNELDEFFKSQDIQFISYNESEKILGQTTDILILQDFESLTPNLIALSIETVRGGGIVVFLLDNDNSIESMINRKSDFLLDNDFVPRYNKRLFRSLINTNFTLFLDSSFQILPISKFNIDVSNLQSQKKLDLKKSCDIIDTDENLINLTKTTDQNAIVKELINTMKDRTERIIYSIQAGRGRGKSVALGISIAKAIDLKFSSIYIAAPALENVKMVFEFLIKALEAIGYTKYKDFKIIYSFRHKKRLIQRIEILKNIKQTIEYHSPFDDLKYHPDLLIIDEAAAIPLPLLKNMLFPNLIIMATTNSGYEGTGRAFSTKMGEYLRSQSNTENNFNYKELFMIKSIRYGDNDPVEKWLNKTLLLNTEVSKISKCPLPSDCNLFYVNRDVLFGGNSHGEIILNDIFSLFIASHYKNSPDDIQILADSPSHEIFTLITNVENSSLPRVLCAIHVSFEGRCEKSLLKKGNLIPWITSEAHFDNDFLKYLGIRIVRIAVHPDYLSMGYGSYALDLLMKWLKNNQHSFLTRLRVPYTENENNVIFYESNEILLPKVMWVGTSFGVTEKLLNFWKKHDMIPICIKQKVSYITGENSLILIKPLDSNITEKVKIYYKNFKSRLLGQLAYNLRNLKSSICIVLLFNEASSKINDKIIFSEESCDRIERFCKGTVDVFMIIDLFPLIARVYFNNQTTQQLTFLQQSVLLLIGCQNKSIDEICEIHKLKTYEVNTILLKIINILKNDLIKK